MKKFLALVLSLAMCLSLAACGGSANSDSSSNASADSTTTDNTATNNGDTASGFQTMTWKFACSATETSTWVQAAKRFGELISEATGGAVTVEYYPADQLTAGNQADGIQALMDGTTELSMHSNLIYSSFDQRFNVVSLPFLFDSTEEADAKLDGAGGDALQDILSGYGVHCIGIAENGFRHPTNSKHPIESPADMSGMKIRVAGSQLLNAAYGAWGADYTNANWSEVFTSLQTGTYDGQENPLPTADAASIQEVQKYMTYWTGAYDCLFFCINQDLYNSLSPELQAIVDDCGQKAVEYQREINRAQDEEIMSKWAAQGIEITILNEEAVAEFKAASAHIYDDFADALTPELIAAFTD